VFFPNTNALVAISKSRRAAKLFCNKILQFLPEAKAGFLYNGNKTAVVVLFTMPREDIKKKNWKLHTIQLHIHKHSRQ